MAVEVRQLVLASKLHPPRLRNVLARPRLINKASVGNNSLVNICAGAGYGKTTLMAQLIREYEGPKVWYQVDHMDEDPAVFLRHLIEGVGAACNGVGERSLSRMSDAVNCGAEGECVLGVLMDEVRESRCEPLRLCFDDYHLIEGTDFASRYINFLINNIPEGSTIIIAGRTLPNLKLGRLRTLGMVQDIREDDLRFEGDELRELLVDLWKIELDAPDIERLQDLMEGWAAGLVLAERYVRAVPDKKKILENNRFRQSCFEYLAEEVLAHLPEVQKDLLLKSSLLDEVDPEICRVAFQERKSPLLLRSSEDFNVFINRIENTKYYRLHPLFRAFLFDRLNLIHSNVEIDALRAEIARSYEEIGLFSEAIEYFRLANSISDVARILETYGDELLSKGEYSTLQRLLDLVDQERLSPPLLIQTGCLLNSQGKNDYAVDVLLRTKSMLEVRGDADYVKCSITLAQCFSDMDRYEDAISTLEPLLDISIPTSLEMEVCYLLGVNYWRIFDQEGVNKYHSLVKAKGVESNPLATIHKISSLKAIQLLLAGDFLKAGKITRNILCAPSYSASLRILYTNNYASCQMLMGEYEIARGLVEECMSSVKKQNDMRWISLILDTYGCSLIALGEKDVGKNYLLEAIKVTTNHEGRTSSACAALCHLGTTIRREGDYSTALKHHKQCLETAREANELYDIAISMVNIGADLARLERFKDASAHLDQAENIAVKHKFNYVITQVDFHRAWIAFADRDEERVRDSLSKAMDRAAILRHDHFLIQEGKISQQLLGFALAHDIQGEYVCRICSKIGNCMLETVETLLSHGSARIRSRAISILGKIGGQVAATILSRSLKDEDEAVRREAKYLLENFPRKDTTANLLTNREQHILEIIATGASNRRIAQQLYISESTVKTHVTHIFRKLGINSRVEAVLYFQNSSNENSTFID